LSEFHITYKLSAETPNLFVDNTFSIKVP